MGPGLLRLRESRGTVAPMTDESKLRKLLAQVSVFRDELDPEISSQLVATLLLVALNPGTRITTLGPRLGLSSSAAARNVERLASVVTRTGVRGWGLVEYRDHPEDRRSKALYLTPKGEKFLHAVLSV